MLVFHLSNRTEYLAEKLAETIATPPLPSVFKGETLLIQSRGMERMLTYYLADTFGVWANSEYLLPLDFITTLLEITKIASGNEDFSRSSVAWSIEKQLRELHEPEFGPLRNYLQGALTERKRYQLAKQIAHLFDQYQLMRPDILAQWQDGKLVYNDESEQWQRLLWLKISDQAHWSKHRGAQITELISRLSTEQPLPTAELPERLFIFGLHTLPPLFLKALYAFSNHCPVHFFLLSPFQGYWGDMASDKMVVKRKLVEKPLAGTLFDHTSQPFHPLLVKLGKQGAHFQELLLNTVDHYHEGWVDYHQPIDNTQPRLLNFLQAGILSGIDQPEQERAAGVEIDDTIKIVSCHSPYRELMVLKDYILSWFHEDQHLEPHEIAIMAPDIADYSPFIPAVFDDLQWSLADRGVGEANKYYEAFQQFLALQEGRFEYSAVISVLERPEIHQCFGLNSNDLALLKIWLNQAGVRWGLSPAQRKSSGSDTVGTGSWQEGLARLLMGVAIDTDDVVDGILPYGVGEGDGRNALGGLSRYIRLLESVYDTCRSPYPLAQWALFLNSWCDQLFGNEENAAVSELSRLFQTLAESAQYNDQTFCFPIIQEWFTEQGQAKASAGFLSGKLMFCSMLPMRTIPFKIICLLGMNAGAFPQVTTARSFDLLSQEYRPGDRSVREDHRYQFLEAIISARQRLYLSFVGQSIQSGKTLPPSVLISELIDSVHEFHGLDLTIEAHPLHSSSSRYFSEDSGLFSFAETQYQIATSFLHKGSTWQGIWQSEKIPHPSCQGVDLPTFIRFFKNPQRYFVEQVLGISLRRPIESPEDSEPFELDGLHSFLISREIFERLSTHELDELLLTRLQIRQQWPLGAPGEIQFRAHLEHLKRFYQRITACNMGDPVEDLSVDLEIDGFRLQGALTNRYHRGQLNVTLAGIRGRDYFESWIRHLVLALAKTRGNKTVLVGSKQTITYATVDQPLKHLAALVKLFRAGHNEPLKLFVEPGFAYTEQLRKNQGKGRKAPLLAAYQSYQNQKDRNYAPEWNILFADRSPEELLGEDFLQIATDVLHTIQSHLLTTNAC